MRLAAAACFCLQAAALFGAAPPGSLLEVRLLNSVSSYANRSGDAVWAEVVAPLMVDGRTLVPQGTSVEGRLEEVRRIGWGTRRVRASLRMNFHTIHLPAGRSAAIQTRLRLVDNARETVTRDGRILGIRATAPMGHRLAGITRNIFIWDPLLQAVLAGATNATLRFPEAEIYLPASTELVLETLAPLVVEPAAHAAPPAPAALTEEEENGLKSLIRQMTWRLTTTDVRRKADVVNLVFIGEEEWLERAARAAGWVRADRLTVSSGWRTFRSVAEAAPYPEAPISPMLLDENPAVLELSKSLNNYSKRHHMRVFTTGREWQGRPVLAAAATHDQAITWSFSNGRLIHVIDPEIDNERAKVVNDLLHAGCVEAAAMLPRPWVPASLRLSTGQNVRTDGMVAVMKLNRCLPAKTPDPPESLQGPRPGRFGRVVRQVMLTAAHDFTFNNPVYQAGLGIRWLYRRAAGKEDHRQPERKTAVTAIGADEPAMTAGLAPD